MSKLVAEAAKSARRSLTGWWRTNCPLCVARTGKSDRKQALAINMRSGAYYCWKCHASGHIKERPEAEELEAPREVVVMTPPESFMPLARDRSMILAPARKYARKRCPERLWETVNLGACISGKHAGRVIVPIMADDGTWLGWVGRTWSPSDRAYSYPMGMNRGELLYRGGQLWSQAEEPVVVVEGVFDAIHMWPHGIALLGKASEYQMESLSESTRPVVIVLDGDAWQESYAMVLRLKLHGKKNVGYVRLPPKLDPDEVDRAWLADEIDRAI